MKNWLRLYDLRSFYRLENIRIKIIVIGMIILSVVCGCNDSPKERAISIESETNEWSISLVAERDGEGTLIQGRILNKTISNEHGLMLVLEPAAGEFYKDSAGVFQKPTKHSLSIEPGQSIVLNHKTASLFEYYKLPNKLRPKLIANKR